MRQLSPARNESWNPANLSDIRQSIVRLALAETDAQHFLDTALTLISTQLGIAASYSDHCNSELQCPAGMESFIVKTQESVIGVLLAEQKTLENAGLLFREMQELADIIGLSMLSLRQNAELASLENESEEMLLFAPDIIFVTDENGRIKMANHKAHELLGTAPGTLNGKPIDKILGVSTANSLRNGEKIEIEILGQRGRRLASFNVSQVAQETGEVQILMVGRDITTERQAELTLRRTERSTMMAQTIDYLLHEVNNPLGALLSNISTAIRKTDRLVKSASTAQTHPAADGFDDELFGFSNQLHQMSETLRNAKKAGTRIHDAMKILRTANQKRTLNGQKSIDVAFELGLAISALEQEHRKIRVMKSLDRLPMMDAPPLHLSEIFGAVLKNAAESVEAVTRDVRQILVTGGVREGQLVITIEDNGPGIPGNYREKIFMPFFTTKPLGNAIGLGLPMASDMAKRVGGRIEATASAKLGGACFRIILPVR